MAESSNSNVRTIILVGRTGNGKSATGNTILGRKAFKSMSSSSVTTISSKLQSNVLDNGKVINVIDTPGIFDARVEVDYISKEIVKCVDKAPNGIHAIVVVLSVRTRFSQEEDDALKTFQEFFGPKIIDYMIVLFTGGDDLEDNELTLEQYMGFECPEKLKNILRMCKNRYILFDNKTKDPAKKEQQLEELLELVDATIDESGGKPYTSDLIIELKVELKLRDTANILEEQLAEEQAARLKAEKFNQVAQQKSTDEILKHKDNSYAPLLKLENFTTALRKSTENIRKLKENLERAEKEHEQLARRTCSIM